MNVTHTGHTANSRGGTFDIAIVINRCGIIYRFKLDSEFNVDRMEPVLAGGPYDSGAATDECDVNNIAQPDNVFVLNDGHVLIEEGSGNHEHNMLWLFNPKGMK